VALARFALLLLALAPALALGGANKGQDDVGPGPNDGPGYSGFVRDAGGAPIEDARVTASYRGGLEMVTRSNAAGFYNLPGYRKTINPDGVVRARGDRFPRRHSDPRRRRPHDRRAAR
jgi:hypothetical protein